MTCNSLDDNMPVSGLVSEEYLYFGKLIIVYSQKL